MPTLVVWTLGLPQYLGFLLSLFSCDVWMFGCYKGCDMFERLLKRRGVFYLSYVWMFECYKGCECYCHYLDGKSWAIDAKVWRDWFGFAGFSGLIFWLGYICVGYLGELYKFCCQLYQCETIVAEPSKMWPLEIIGKLKKLKKSDS